MFDELELLRERPELQQLLTYYAETGEADREAWQDRLMVLEGVESRELVKLHGLLIAFGWVDQNTGNTPAGQPGTVTDCYRVTTGGLRASKAVRAEPEQCEADAVETIDGNTAGAPAPKRHEWKKGKQPRSKKAAEDQAETAQVPTEEPVPALA